MSKTILKAENISKQYRLGLVGTGSLMHDINRWWHRIRGKEDPYLKVGAVNDRSAKATDDYVWALKDINFEVKEGEVLGIIGKNGAGKSTLLKLLSRVTSPTTGVIKSRGRIASLLEVGTGFHPELTGRENIYLNGAILGMTKAEIDAKVDEIIEFSGCEMYIDTPTKRYSSGMTVRLGFAVAAHLEPDILVVDEVLAVGDVEFQKKAIGKMQDISSGEGRTVLFVSHNMASVQNLCTRAIVLENGKLIYSGTAQESVSFYLSNKVNDKKQKDWDYPQAPGDKGVKLLNIGLYTTEGDNEFYIDSNIVLKYTLKCELINSTIGTHIKVKNKSEEVVLLDGAWISKDRNSKSGIYEVSVKLPHRVLNSGQYSIDMIVGENRKYALLHLEDVVSFTVNFGRILKHERRRPSLIYSEMDWNVSFNE